MEVFKETKELLGHYLSKSWNGMSDFYKVVGATNKSLVLQELEWTVCPFPPGEGDPVHNNTKLVFKDGNPVFKQEYDYSDPRRNRYSAPKLVNKRPIIKRVELAEDGLSVKGSKPYRWHVIARNDAEAEAYREVMYWG